MNSELRPKPFILNEQGREFIRSNQLLKTYQYQVRTLMVEAMGIPPIILGQDNYGNSSRRQMEESGLGLAIGADRKSWEEAVWKFFFWEHWPGQ